MRERHLSLQRVGPGGPDAAAGRDSLLWSSRMQAEPDKLLWMEGGVEKDTPGSMSPQDVARGRPSGQALPLELQAAPTVPATGDDPHPQHPRVDVTKI